MFEWVYLRTKNSQKYINNTFFITELTCIRIHSYFNIGKNSCEKSWRSDFWKKKPHFNLWSVTLIYMEC